MDKRDVRSDMPNDHHVDRLLNSRWYEWRTLLCETKT
jgi:hypothetical protein